MSIINSLAGLVSDIPGANLIGQGVSRLGANIGSAFGDNSGSPGQMRNMADLMADPNYNIGGTLNPVTREMADKYWGAFNPGAGEINVGEVSPFTSGGGVGDVSLPGGNAAGVVQPTYTPADISSFNTQRQNITGSANDWAGNYGIGLGVRISDYINSLRQGQQGIDERGIQNELSLKQGRAGILGMVANGIRSGGVMLANRNATDSSASAALANAYGEIGRGQLSNTGNQYGIEDRNIGLAQDTFNTQAQAGANRIRTSETQDIAGAVSRHRDKLAVLDAWAADKSLPERIQIEQEKAAIQSQIEQALSQFGDQLTGGVAGVQPTSKDQRRSTAASLAGAGQVAANPFNFSSNVPLQFQNSPFSSDLPLFTSPTRKKSQ